MLLSLNKKINVCLHICFRSTTVYLFWVFVKLNGAFVLLNVISSEAKFLLISHVKIFKFQLLSLFMLILHEYHLLMLQSSCTRIIKFCIFLVFIVPCTKLLWTILWVAMVHLSNVQLSDVKNFVPDWYDLFCPYFIPTLKCILRMHSIDSIGKLGFLYSLNSPFKGSDLKINQDALPFCILWKRKI